MDAWYRSAMTWLWQMIGASMEATKMCNSPSDPDPVPFIVIPREELLLELKLAARNGRKSPYYGVEPGDDCPHHASEP